MLMEAPETEQEVLDMFLVDPTGISLIERNRTMSARSGTSPRVDWGVLTPKFHFFLLLKIDNPDASA